MSLRTVALDTPRLCRSTIIFEPTGSWVRHVVGDDRAQHREPALLGVHLHLPRMYPAASSLDAHSGSASARSRLGSPAAPRVGTFAGHASRHLWPRRPCGRMPTRVSRRRWQVAWRGVGATWRAGGRFGRRWLLVAAGAAALVGRRSACSTRCPSPPRADRRAAGCGGGSSQAPRSRGSGSPRRPGGSRCRSCPRWSRRRRCSPASPAIRGLRRRAPTAGGPTSSPPSASATSTASTAASTSGTSGPTSSPECPASPRCGCPAPPTCCRPTSAGASWRWPPDDPVSPLPARRIAGPRRRRGCGSPRPTRTPRSGASTSGPTRRPGLPLRVEVAPRAHRAAAAGQRSCRRSCCGPPDPARCARRGRRAAGDVSAEAVDLGGALRVLDAAPAAAARSPAAARVALTGTQLPGVGVYGTGLAGFVLVPVSRGIAGRALDGGRRRGRRADPGPARAGGPRRHAAAVAGGAQRTRRACCWSGRRLACWSGPSSSCRGVLGARRSPRAASPGRRPAVTR